MIGKAPEACAKRLRSRRPDSHNLLLSRLFAPASFSAAAAFSAFTIASLSAAAVVSAACALSSDETPNTLLISQVLIFHDGRFSSAAAAAAVASSTAATFSSTLVRRVTSSDGRASNSSYRAFAPVRSFALTAMLPAEKRQVADCFANSPSGGHIR